MNDNVPGQVAVRHVLQVHERCEPCPKALTLTDRHPPRQLVVSAVLALRMQAQPLAGSA
jgi:hypothetical protein